MLTSRKFMWSFLVLLSFAAIIGACSLQNTAQPVNNPAATLTSAAKTVSAELNQGGGGINATSTAIAATVIRGLEYTQTAESGQIQQPSSTLPPVIPTNTPVPPTSTSVPPTPVPPTATQIPIPCDRAGFVEDVTYPDGTDVVQGTQFVKTWRLVNKGTCTWNSSYALVFISGDAMGGPASQPLTTGTVAPGQEVDVSVTLTAPDKPKTYAGYWELRNGAGVIFGLGTGASDTFFVKIDVISPVTPTPVANVVFDLLGQAQYAQWRNATTNLPFLDPDIDTPGVATYVTNATLENNKTYSKVLATYPQMATDGLISGLFPAYTVKSGDHFRTQVGFKSSCSNASVQFRFGYKEGSTVVMISTWNKSCDGALLTIDIDLSNLAGKTVQFILEVSANGPFVNDHSVWVSPEFEH